MIPTILIITGGILTGIGLLGFGALLFEPFFRAINIVFKRKDDYVFYETKPGKNLLQKEYKALTGGFGFMLAVGIIMLALGLFIKYSKTGNDLLLSENVAGITRGNDTSQYSELLQSSELDKFRDSEGNEYSYYIIVTKTDINVNGMPVSDEDALRELFLQMDRTNTVFLIDDFAASKTFNDVMELLDECGMKYKTEE